MKSIEVDREENVSKEAFIERINNNVNIMNNIIRYKANGSNIISAIDTIEKSRYELDSADNGLFIIKRKSTVKKSLCFCSV